MTANLDTRRIRRSTPAELRDYYSQIVKDAPIQDITTQLLLAVERGSISPLPFGPWLGVAQSPPAIRAALTQDTSVFLRKLAIKFLRKALCSPRWREAWDCMGGTAGLLDIFADLSVIEIKAACNAIGRSGRGADVDAKRELFTEFFKALHPDHFPDTPHKTKDQRALKRYYQLIIPACSKELVEETIASGLKGSWKETRSKDIVKYYPECMQKELLRLLSTEQLSDDNMPMFKGLLHRHPPRKSPVQGFSMSMDFSLKVLDMLSNSAHCMVEDKLFIDHIVNPLLERAIKGHAEWHMIKLIVDLTMRYLESHPSVGRHITALKGDFLQQVAYCWSQRTDLFDKQLRRLCSHPVFGTTSKTNIGDWVGVLSGIPTKQSYPLLKLCYQESTSLDLDSDADLGKTKGTIHWNFFTNLSPADALLLFARLRRVRGDVDLISRDVNFSIFSQTSTFEGYIGDPDIFHIWLLNLNRKEEDAKSLAGGYIDRRKNKAVTASQPEQRAFFAKSALFATVASGSLDMLKDTLEWTKRFLRDPLVTREIYPRSYPGEATRLLSGIPESIQGMSSLAELNQRVLLANAMLKGMFDTACEALEEPSFNARDWDGVLGLFYDVVKLRIDLTPTIKKQLNASDQDLLACMWVETISMLISVEEKAQKEEYERLGANNFGGIMTYNQFSTIELESCDVSTYAFLDSLARARDELWCRLRPTTHPATLALPEPFPRGLPLQFLTAPWALNVKDLSSLAPYIASRTQQALFPDPKTALQPAPSDKDSQKAIGMFVDSYQHALELYIPKVCDKSEREARVRHTWEYAIGPLSSNRMTEDEAIRFWSDKGPSQLDEWPPKGAMGVIKKAWPVIPEDDGSGGPCEWNPFASRPDFPERELSALTYVDISVAIPRNRNLNPPVTLPVVGSPARVRAYKEDTRSIWDSERDMGEGGVLSALLYLDTKYVNSDRLLATPFPSAIDARYPALFLDEESLTLDGTYHYTASREICGHLDTIPPTLLAQLSRNLVKALDDADAVEEPKAHMALHNAAMQLIMRLAESDRPGLATHLAVHTILARPKSSSWHRQLLKPSFLRKLPASQARSCIKALSDEIIRTVQVKNYTKERSGNGGVAPPRAESHIKVTTIKLLVQLFQDLDLNGTDYSLSVLSTLSNIDTHVDVRLNIVKSLLALFETGSRDQSRMVLALLESFIPIAGSLNERQPLDEAQWIQCEQDLSLPEMQAGIADAAGSESPILVALVEHFRRNKNATDEFQQFVDRVLMPVLQTLRDQTARWAALFIRKYGLEDAFLEDLRIPSIPRDPSVNELLLSVKNEKPAHVPRVVLEEYVAYMCFSVAPSAPLQSMNKRLNADPALAALPEVQCWMRLYGPERSLRTDRACSNFIELLEHAVDSSDNMILTPKLIQEQYLKLFTTLVWNDTPTYDSLTKGFCSSILSGRCLEKSWWIQHGKPILEAMVSYVHTLRTREWERDPARKPSVLPDTFSWRLRLLDYPWPSRDEGEATREQKCKVFAGQLEALIDEMSSLPIYHEPLRDLYAYLGTDIVSSGSGRGEKRYGRTHYSYATHDLLHDALMTNRVLTAIYVGDITKTRLSWLTAPELLKVEVAATLVQLVDKELNEGRAIVDEEIRARLKAMVEKWKVCENEGVRRRGWEIDERCLSKSTQKLDGESVFALFSG
jgi:hypothetical protein